MKHILFFISHQPNPRFIKQINYLAKNNYHVTLLYFQRSTLANLDTAITGSIVQHKLGEIPNMAQPFKRLWRYIKALYKIRKLINKIHFEVVLVNNIDILVLYVLSGFSINRPKSKPKVVMEISDLREFVFDDRFIARKIKILERKLYEKYVDKLIITSKKFYTHHFKKFYKKEVFVLENKLLSKEISFQRDIKKSLSDKTIIGIVGLLLRRNEYIQLFETYKNDSEVNIHIYGKGKYQNMVEAYASKYDNIIYFGPYNAFKDTQAIYESIDIIYLVYDTYHTSLNNKLALPNKLYECMYYKVPLLCSKGTYLEEIVMKWGIGTSIDYKKQGEIKEAVGFLVKNINKMENNFASIPQKSYLGDLDYKALASFLAK